MSKSIYTRSLAGLSAAALALVGFAGAAYADPEGDASPNPEATQTTPPTETDAPGEGSEDESDGKDTDDTEKPEETEPGEKPVEPDKGEADKDEADKGEESGKEATGPDMGTMAAEAKAIDILNITDFHGRIKSGPVISSFVKQERAKNPEGTIFSSSGDNFGASTFESSILDDKPSIDVLNAMGLEVSSVGNHEFDKGWEDFKKKIAASKFPVLGANVKGETPPELKGSHVVTLDNGVRVGFVGLITEDMPSLVSPAGIKGITWESITDTANKVADELTDGNDDNGEADVLVALVHEGPATSEITAGGAFKKFAEGVSEKYTAVFAGHTHIAYNTEFRGIQFLQAGKYGGSSQSRV
ncbi:hypothetical protein BSZ39_03275 [Bowdeniella nasicola]|uniref:Calcineurin-like phosphoesterase domain-containing protein n=1 Tax=Bowdeniella nasicola TaxID=208480 RepID=A0A1Q5Q425_9ACTO|nr:metallophosphoesterase [Bowdeniella nasicola]OKL54563.1 hypothetical protein BSZ39_03275 [Bowdeniella nasicola]